MKPKIVGSPLVQTGLQRFSNAESTQGVKQRGYCPNVKDTHTGSHLGDLMKGSVRQRHSQTESKGRESHVFPLGVYHISGNCVANYASEMHIGKPFRLFVAEPLVDASQRLFTVELPVWMDSRKLIDRLLIMM